MLQFKYWKFSQSECLDVAIFSPRNVQIELRDHDFVLGIFIMRSNWGGVLVYEKILFYILKFKCLVLFKFIKKKLLTQTWPEDTYKTKNWTIRVFNHGESVGMVKFLWPHPVPNSWVVIHLLPRITSKFLTTQGEAGCLDRDCCVQVVQADNKGTIGIYVMDKYYYYYNKL
jgi:hypothetical protein